MPKPDFAAGKLIARLPKKDWHTTLLQEATIYGELFGAKISFIAYPFFTPVQPLRRYGRVRVLAAADIAVMKIIALSQRGKKRDFIDLYQFSREVEPLDTILRRVPLQYPTVRHDYHHLLKSLTYFADAENDPEPKLFVPIKWQDVKRYFECEVKRLVPIFLKLD